MERGLSITELSTRTRIGVGYLQKIEEGDLNALPPGFYTRAFVRAYAEAVGLSQDAVTGLLATHLPAPEDPVPHAALELTPDQSTVSRDARTNVLSRLLERHRSEQRPLTDGRRQADEGRKAPEPAAAAPRATPLPRRLLAASADGVLLAVIYLCVLGITAVYCGVTLEQLVSTSGLAVFTVLGMITGFYVLLMGGVAGRTIGAMLLDVRLVSEPEQPLDLSAIARRSMDCVRADMAAAAEVKTLVEGLLRRRTA